MVWAAALPALLSGAASIGSSILSRNRGTPKSGLDKRKTKLIDELLSSLKGQGAYSDLFNPSEEAFQKSFVEPAKERFRSQIAPQIQQSYIASGQQRGTGLEDSLSRAGVNLDQMLNENYYKFQQDALARKQNAINQILGTQYGQGQPGQSVGQAASQGFGGFLGGQVESGGLEKLLKEFLGSNNQSSSYGNMALRGVNQSLRTGYAG